MGEPMLQALVASSPRLLAKMTPHARAGLVQQINAIATVIIAATAVITAIAALRTIAALRDQSRLTKATIEVDVLLRLEATWRSPRMTKTRSAAAQALLAGVNGDLNVDGLLYFLELIAMLMKRGVLEEETTWHTFYWPMVNYWQAAATYAARVVQEEGSSTWINLPIGVARMRAIEASKSGRRGGAIGPSDDQTQRFLNDEAKLSG
jgi:hypothetical protein